MKETAVTESNLVPFSFEGNPIRVLERHGEPWFVAKDVAQILGYTNPRKAIRDHCKAYEPVGGTDRSSLGLDPQTLLIPERDLYRLIAKSTLPSAADFEEWVFGKVLPSIRKTGGYGKTVVDMRDPAQLAAAALQLTQINAELQAQNTQLTVRAERAEEALSRLAGFEGPLFVRAEAAPLLQVKERFLSDWLKENRWIHIPAGSAHWFLYQDKIDKGYGKMRLDPIRTGVMIPVVGLTLRGMGAIAISFHHDEPRKLWPLLASFESHKLIGRAS